MNRTSPDQQATPRDGSAASDATSDDSLGLPAILCGPCLMTSKPAAVHVAEEQALKYKLVALDLDGTTLTTDKRITETTASAIHHAYARGATICVASGRMPYRIMGYASQLPAVFYAAAFSGGCAFRVEDGKIQEYLKDYPMPAAAIDSFLDLMATQEGGEDMFGIYETECLYITNPSVAEDLKKMGLPHQLLPQGGLAERFRGSECAMKVWVMQRPDESASEKTFTAALREAVERHGGVVICFSDCYEIVSSSAGKEHALAELCEQLGLSMGRDVLAFGDEGNDIGMLRAAAYSIAPANGAGPAKQAAKAISAWTNDNDCVGRELMRVFGMPR